MPKNVESSSICNIASASKGVNQMYTSSRLVTHGLFSLVLPLGDELVRDEVGQGLVRANDVASVLPGQEILVQGGHLQR